MTDAKGPYTYYERADGRFIIEGPGIHMDGGAKHLTSNEVNRLNMVFALGHQRGCAAGRSSRDGLRAALEEVEHWQFDIMGDCVADAQKLAAKALRADEEGSHE